MDTQSYTCMKDLAGLAHMNKLMTANCMNECYSPSLDRLPLVIMTSDPIQAFHKGLIAIGQNMLRFLDYGIDISNSYRL